MANEVSKEDIITTQEGTELTVKPLTIRSLRKFMGVINELNELQERVEKEQADYEKAMESYRESEDEDAEEPSKPDVDEFAVIEIMLKAARIALEKHNPDFVADEDNLEDELDIDVLNKILETSGGIKMGDPNLAGTPAKRA